MPNTDKAWERFGQDDPYYAVLPTDEFLKDRFDQAAHEAFFRSGQDYAAMVLGLVERFLSAGTHFNRILDFGCGVGRLTLAFALHADEVVGVDISSGMLEEAKRNADAFGAHNTQWVLSDDDLTRVTGDFDFVTHSSRFNTSYPSAAIGLSKVSSVDCGTEASESCT
jgi:methylase of polypeptide subunit release factors